MSRVSHLRHPFLREREKSSSYQHMGSRRLIHTIGQISLRPKRKQTSTFEDTLKSLNDPAWDSEAMSKSLTMTADSMGHSAEIKLADISNDFVEIQNEMGGIMRKIEYQVADAESG